MQNVGRHDAGMQLRAERVEAGEAKFAGDYRLVREGAAGAAIVLGDRRAEQPGGAGLGPHVALVRALLAPALDVRGELGADEPPRLLLEQHELFGHPGRSGKAECVHAGFRDPAETYTIPRREIFYFLSAPRLWFVLYSNGLEERACAGGASQLPGTDRPPTSFHNGSSDLMTWFRSILPGLLLSSSVAVAAVAAAPLVAYVVPIPAMVIALLIGIALNPLAQRTMFQPGIVFCLKTLLRWAVALLGLRIALGEI